MGDPLPVKIYEITDDGLFFNIHTYRDFLITWEQLEIIMKNHKTRSRKSRGK